MTPTAPMPTHAPVPPAPPAAPPPGRSLVERIIRDPNAIWMREMRQSARLGRTPWILFAITLSIALLMCSIGGIAAASQTSPASIGSILFQTFFSLAYLVVTLVGPAVAANSIASEREGKTWEAVLLTGLTPKTIARGKFAAAYTTIALYIVVLAPVGALSFLFGGVTATDVVLAFAFLFILAALTVAFGLAVSSLFQSLRAALVVTLVLAILIGPIIYGIFGVFASFGIHEIWSQVGEATPVWLPIALSRAKFGLEYVAFLVVLPLFLLAMPAWFLYELTCSNLTNEGDDRSTGLKRWFAIATPLFAIVCVVPSIASQVDDARSILGLFGMTFFGLYLAFCALLFASETPGPSRRVRIHWDREDAGFLRRFFGPGLGRTSLLVAVFGFVGIFCVGGAIVANLAIAGAGTTKTTHYEEQNFFFAVYSACFFLFHLGLASWVRSRGSSPWIARLITTAVVFFASVGPWAFAAIAGVLSHKEGWIVAAPSPFYVVYMLVWIDDSHPADAQPVVEAGVACAFLWAVLGLVLLSVASRRAWRVVVQHDAAVAQAEAALRAEDEQIAAPLAPPEAVVDAAPADPVAP
jgi:ABC-type transport system involved in multi-copper enzyme maturation permease subunit